MESEPAAPSADGVRVAVRVRPLNERERSLLAAGQGGAAGISWALTEQSMTQIVEQRPVQANSFAFDHVFLQDVNNETVYKSLAAPVVLSSVEGINGVIFAYGQTAAGKTHTMLGSDSDPGITRRSISELFSAICATRGRGFLLRASYIEIYNEIIMDLLSPGGEGLKIHEDVVNKRVYVNAKEEVVTSVQDVMDMLSAGEEARAVGVTNMNERSSRSHTIFTLRIESRELKPTEAADGSDEEEDDDGVAVRASTLTLVDLAGSERVAFTKAEGQRLKEGAHINKSLLTLGTVINKLSSGTSAAHIPYRDSKLTRILQPALGGNARTAIVCAVTPSIVHMDETLSTLRFASRAKKVTNHAHANEFLDDRAKLRRAQKEIAKLKAENEAMRKSGADPDDDFAAPSEASLALQERKAKKRMRIFLERFDKLVSAPRSTRASAPDASSSTDWRVPVEVPDTWHCRPMLREALDLRGVAPKGAGSAFNTPGKGAGDEGSEQGDADLRMRALQAEKELARAKAEIECERSAMESEVLMLETATDSAQRAQNKSAVELEQAMSLLANAQVTSLVDEIFEGACMISERDGKLAAAEKEIKRIQGVQAELAATSTKLAVSEKALGEALKREKRGVGPVIKEKATLQKKLGDVESKLKDVRQKLSSTSTEKAALDRELRGEERKNKTLSSEVEKHRKHKGMADARVAKQHEDEKKKIVQEHEEEKKKLGGELKVAKEKNIATNGIVAAQKSKIEDMQKQYGALSTSLVTTNSAFEELKTVFGQTSQQLATCKEGVEELTAKLNVVEAENEDLKKSNAAQAEKYAADMAAKEAALETVGETMEKVKVDLTIRLSDMQTEVCKLREKLRASEKTAVDDRRASSLAMKSAIEQKDKELEELQEKLKEIEKTAADERRASVDALTAAIEQKDEEVKELREKLQESEKAVEDDRRASADNLRTAIEEKDTELEQLREKLKETEKAAVDERRASVDALTTAIEQKDEEVKELREKLQESEKAVVDDRRSSADNVRTAIEEKDTELEQLREKLIETEKVAIDERRASVDALTTAIEQKDQELEELREKLQESEKAVVDDRRASADNVRTAIEEKDEELEQLREKLKETEKAAVDERRASVQAVTTAIEQKDMELEELREKLQEYEKIAEDDRSANANTLRAAIEQKDKELEELGSALTRTKSEKERTIAVVKAAEEERIRLKNQLLLLESEVEKHRTSDEDLRRKSGALEQEVEGLRRALQDTQQSDIENCKSCSAVNKKLHTLQREVGEGLLHTSRGVKAAGQEIGRRKTETKAELQRLAERIKALLHEQQLAAAEKIRTMESLTKEKARTHAAESQLAAERVGEGVVGALQRKLRRRDGTIESLTAALRKAEEGVGRHAGWGDARRVAELEAEGEVAERELARLRGVEERLGRDRLKLVEDAHRLRQKIKEREAVWTRSLHERRGKDLQRLERMVEDLRR